MYTICTPYLWDTLKGALTSGLSAALRACSTTVCSQPSNRFLKCASWFPWINSVPWTKYMHPSVLSSYLGGDSVHGISFKVLTIEYLHPMDTISTDFNRFQLILLVGIPRPSGTRQYQYGPGFDQNTTAFINWQVGHNPVLWLVPAKSFMVHFEKGQSPYPHLVPDFTVSISLCTTWPFNS